MSHWRHGAIILLLAALFVFAGCGGGSTAAPDPGPGNGDQQPTGMWQGTAANSAIESPGLAGVPPIPDDKAASRATSAEPTEFELLGSEYLQKYNAEVDGTKLVLNAPLEAGDGEYPIAYGLYKFTDLLDYDLQALNIECLPAVLGMEYYVGVADYTIGDWLWFGPVGFPEFQLDLSDLDHQFVSELGNMYFVVVCEAGNGATISKSTLTAIQGGEDPALPGAPSNLVATDGAFADKVVVEWNHGENANHYELWRRTTEDGEWDDLAELEGTRYEDTAVEPGHTYWYKARSVNDQGTSDWSNIDSGFASAGGGEGGDPGQANELWASDGTYENYVHVEWGVEGDYDGFDLWRKQDGEAYEWHHLAYTEGMSYDDEAVDAGVVYIYKVRAILNDHEGAWSNSDSGYASGEWSPPAPFDLTASDGTYETFIRVEWATEGDGAFEVWRKRDGEGYEWQKRGITEEMSFDDPEIDLGVVYIYKVRAFVGEHFSDFSNTDSGYASGGGGGPNPPYELWASDGTYDTKVRLEWGYEGDNFDYFEVWRKQDGEAYEWHKIGQTEAVSYDDFEVDAGTVYIYKVRAILGEHESEFSNTDSGYASGGGGGVNPPFELWATDGAHNDRVVVSWSHEGDYSYFEVWRKRDGEGYEWGRIGTTEALHYVDMEVDPGVIYIYKARAILGELESEFSNTDSGYASEGSAPPAPWGLTATDGDYSDKVVVLWSYEIEGAAFDVYRKLHEEGAEWAVIGETQDHGYHDFDVDPGVVYDYKVVAWVEGSHSEPSNVDSGYASSGSGPEPPSGLVASDGLYSDKVRVEWNYEGDYSYFDLWRKRDGEAYAWEHLANTEIPEYDDFAVDAGVTYWYKVRVIVGEHESEFSNHDSGYASGEGIPGPFELWASDGTYPDYVHVEWIYEGDYSYFDVWRKRDGEGYEWAHLGNAEGPHYNDDSVDAGVVYIYKARAILGEQISEFSNTDSGYAGDGGGG